MLPLYQNIKNRRIELGMSQQDLAEKMGYTSRSTIAKIESGKNDIPQSKIIAFATALNTTPASLMGWGNDSSGADNQKKPSAENGKGLDKNTVVIVGRDGRRIEKKLSDEQIKALEMMVEQLPPFEL